MCLCMIIDRKSRILNSLTSLIMQTQVSLKSEGDVQEPFFVKERHDNENCIITEKND